MAFCYTSAHTSHLEFDPDFDLHTDYTSPVSHSALDLHSDLHTEFGNMANNNYHERTLYDPYFDTCEHDWRYFPTQHTHPPIQQHTFQPPMQASCEPSLEEMVQQMDFNNMKL